MRVQEIVESVYKDNLRDTVVNLLTAVRSEGITEIDTDQLVIDLQNQGYSVDNRTIFTILKNLPIVSSADEKTIKIKNAVAGLAGGRPPANGAEKVNQLAQKQVKKDLGL
jgi:hypothetical protein